MTQSDSCMIMRNFVVNIGAMMCDRFPMEVGKGPNKIKVEVQCRAKYNLV